MPANEDLVGTDAPTGDDLLDLVDNSLFPVFKDLNVAEFSGKARQRAELLRSVFEDAYNYMKSGTLMRQVINKINHDIDFNESKTRHLFGDIYEQILRDLQGAGNAGEFYTPRAATQFAVDMVAPKLGETVLDPACGTGGFLTASFERMRVDADTPDKLADLKASIHGVEKKALPHLLCVTNLMVHGVEVPSIRHGNTLARPLRDYGPNDQVDVIVTNPPFGGMEEDGIENNFPSDFRTRETADLFLVLVMELLKDGGRAAIVLPDGTLFGEGIKTRIKQRLLEECNLHTIVRLPKGVFAPYTTIKTNILFFTKGEPTKEVWFYEHPYPDGYKSYSKTKPMRIEEFEPEKAWWADRHETNFAWTVSVEDLAARGFDFDVPNPNAVDAVHEDAAVLLDGFRSAAKGVGDATDYLGEGLAEVLDETTAQHVVEALHAVVEAPDGIESLQRVVLDLAVRGRLSNTLESDEPVEDLLRRVAESGEVSGTDSLEPISSSDEPWEIPSSWRWVRFKHVVDFAAGRTPPTKDPTYWTESDGHAWVAIGDMPEGGEVGRTARRVSARAAEEIFRGGPDPAGTILMSFKLTIGKVARLGVPAYHNEAIIAITTPFEEIREYLFRTLPLLTQGGDSKAAIKGNTLNKTSLTNLAIPLPPLEEQARVVEQVDDLMTRCEAVQEALAIRELAAERVAARMRFVVRT